MEKIKKYISFLLDFLSRFFTQILPKYIKENFEITSSKASKITGCIVGLVLMITVIIFNNSFLSQEYASKWLLLAIALILPFVITLAIIYNIKIKDTVTKKVLFVVLFAIMPILSMTMTECLNNIYVYDMTYMGFVANYVVILLLYFLFFSVSGSLRFAILAVNPIIYGFALAHAYLVSFRGSPFIPMDIFGITTAINVGSTYDYTPTDIIIIGSLLFILLVVIGIKVKTPKFTFITRLISRVFMGVFFLVIACLFYLTSIFADAGIKPDFWNQTRGYKNYGFVYNFVCNTKYLYMSVPEGYNASDVGDYVSKKVTEADDDNSNVQKTPNIICIMNESLSDLRVLGDFGVTEDYMPFMHSLTENTVKGNLYVPVIGAGTSNTEFEFLTGHSTAFLPSGSNAYMLYIKNPLASLVSTLKAQNYSAYAFHPYYASGWNRVSVYQNMGFSSFKSLENLIDPSIIEEYNLNNSDPDYLQNLVTTHYPQNNNMLLRQYISDSYDYDVLIDDFNNRDKTKPYFVFNVTMQNHGGYTTNASNFSQTIGITSTENTYTKAINYLSLVKASDNAFKNLISYFTTVDEPTIICMFGDHQPSIESKFIAEILGVDDLSGLSIEQEQNRHITPFYIWANYDIEEKEIDKLSVNYLSTYVLKTAGVKLPKYNKYLYNLSKKLPVIDTVGYIDSEDKYYKWSSDSPYSKLLKEYEQIQYNNIFDYKNSDTETFYVNGYSASSIAAEIEAQNKEEEDTTATTQTNKNKVKNKKGKK